MQARRLGRQHHEDTMQEVHQRHGSQAPPQAPHTPATTYPDRQVKEHTTDTPAATPPPRCHLPTWMSL